MTEAFAEITDLPSEQDATTRKNDALAQATDMIRAVTGQYITYVQDDVVVLRGAGRRLLQLPQIPVVSVYSVTVQLGADRQTPLTEGVHYLVGSDGVMEALGCPWPLGWDVEVVYSHGYDPVPGDLVRLTAKLADRVADGTVGARAIQETIGEKTISITYPAAATTGGNGVFDSSDESILDQYRITPLP